MKSVMLGVMVTLAGCASQPSRVETTAEAPDAVRFLAWLDGDYQTNYEADRKLADEKSKEEPDKKDTDQYLEYLAALSASSRGAEAEKKIKQYLSENPKEKRAAFLLGAHYLRTGRKELAAFFFHQLEKDAEFPWKSLLYNNLGMMALKDRNRTVALGYLEKATQSEPATAAPFVNLGALYLQSRSYAEAEKMFRRARDIDDHFEDAVLGLGVALEGQGKFEEAHAVYADFSSNHSGAMSVVYNDAIILGNRLKKRDEAAQLMLRYIQRGGKETAKAHDIIQSWR